MSYYADLGFEAITQEALRERTASPAVQRFLVEGVGPVSVSGIPELGRILLAHGAGAGHLSEFMRQFAAMLASERLQVWAIDFPYMQQMSEEAKRRPPPPVKKTLEHFAAWCLPQDTLLWFRSLVQRLQPLGHPLSVQRPA